MHSNSGLVSALPKQQKLVLISNNPIATFNFCSSLHSPGHHLPPLTENSSPGLYGLDLLSFCPYALLLGCMAHKRYSILQET